MMHVQEGVVNTPVSHRIAASFVVPWSGFVAAFLYYALLAALLLGGVSPQAATVGLAYVAPVLAYAVWLASRMMALVTPHAVPRHAVGFAVPRPGPREAAERAPIAGSCRRTSGRPGRHARLPIIPG